jgi:hypothetical protein
MLYMLQLILQNVAYNINCDNNQQRSIHTLLTATKWQSNLGFFEQVVNHIQSLGRYFLLSK